jgi:hypothetical protein
MNTFPKRRLLICTIVRNARPHLDRWMGQLLRLEAILADAGWDCHLSVAENDSTDGSAEWLDNLPSNAYAFTGKVVVSTEVLGTQQYGSVWNVDRIRNLAAARQKCLDQAGDLSRFSKIAYIEVDVTYDPSWCAELVLANHPKAAGLGEPDVYSGWSLRTLSHPKESCFLYDTCATRATSFDTCWDIGEDGGTWRGKSLVRTPLQGVYANALHSVWSTFNCFCVYNARPFADGLRWSYLNRRLNASRISVGDAFLEADTVAICEDFRTLGYTKVLLNTNCLIRHL